MTIAGLGRFGVWRGYAEVSPEEAGVLERAGYGTIWLGKSPGAELPGVESLLEATEAIVVGTSIVNIWSSAAKEVAESFHRIEQRFPGRFLLGIGAGHPEHTGTYRKPYEALVEYLDELDAAGVPKESRALAALGPRVLQLAADRTAGALPYLVPVEHTRQARTVMGPEALLAPEQKIVLEDDPERARVVGREGIDFYFDLVNYLNNLRRLGFTEDDLTRPGSDRLVDELALHGSAAVVATRLKAHLEAGADHVAIHALNPDYVTALSTLAPFLQN